MTAERDRTYCGRCGHVMHWKVCWTPGSHAPECDCDNSKSVLPFLDEPPQPTAERDRLAALLRDEHRTDYRGDIDWRGYADRLIAAGVHFGPNFGTVEVSWRDIPEARAIIEEAERRAADIDVETPEDAEARAGKLLVQAGRLRAERMGPGDAHELRHLYAAINAGNSDPCEGGANCVLDR